MDFDLCVSIDRPPDAVYAMLADIQQYIDPTSPVPEMEKIPPGPTGVGTRWREVVRLAPGLAMTVWTEVVAAEPGRRLQVAFHGPWMSGILTYSIEPRDGGSVLRQVETLTPHRPLRPVAGAIDRILRPRLQDRLDSIRDVLERDGADLAPAPPAGVVRRFSTPRVRWTLAITAIALELGLFVAWRRRTRRGSYPPAMSPGR